MRAATLTGVIGLAGAAPAVDEDLPSLVLPTRAWSRPDLQVVVLHVVGADVAVGDRVATGRTVLTASPNPSPSTSQIDEYTRADTGEAMPHVHLEARSATET